MEAMSQRLRTLHLPLFCYVSVHTIIVLQNEKKTGAIDYTKLSHL